MSQYHFNDIEAKWQKYWAENQTFKASNQSDKPKYYVLDMFPYPSGAGLHVGHPLGYIASDVYSRYKRHKGFNVLHPMGYDSFGLPAEQYAIQTGQHPAETTKVNIEGGIDKSGTKIKGYRKQLDKIGFSFDWSREVRTSDPKYYKWTQWIFIQLFESWYDQDADKAKGIEDLINIFSSEGNTKVNAACDDDVELFSAEDWNAFTSEEQQRILLKYRLTYLAETEVNWCPELGTVLANDEVVNGVSERGGYPVIRKKMMQWSMRITAYSQRLLDGLDKIDWPQPLKDSQTNWIGRSEGAMVAFDVKADVSSSAASHRAGRSVEKSHKIEVFTTRPDTIFGVSFMTLAPEHDLVAKITTEAQKAEIQAYVEATSRRSERERMADVKTISGVFTGAYAVHPFTGEDIPIWIGDYVLAGYGTGAVMAVPCGDQRDYDFAKFYNLPIPNIFDGADISEEAFTDKENTVIANSDFMNGMNHKDATRKVIEELEKKGAGTGKINYRLRDAVFSRQRYWGEPFPVYYRNGLPQMIAAEHLPLVLPEVEKYLPTEDGDPPLGRADVWAWDVEKNEVVSNELIDNRTVFPLELNTMPGWAGSSCYMFRYMDPGNDDEFADKAALDYWENVDLYIGGSEHATGHLLYSRFWTKFMYDRGYFSVDEPAKKLINQGMILGESAYLNVLNPIIKYNYLGNNCISLFKRVDLKRITSNDLVNDEEIIDLPEERDEFISWLWNYLEDSEEIDYEDILLDFKFRNHDEFNSKNKFFNFLKDKLYFESNSEKMRTNVEYVRSNYELDLDKFENSSLIFKALKRKKLVYNNKFFVRPEIEKMSKSKYNVVNPDDICYRYGADTLRMYEMFLGPLEQAKPWSTAGITGVHSFLKKMWKLYHTGAEGSFKVTDEAASKENMKTLHKTIKKVEEDIENFSFNTSVSTFMIAVNELTAQKCSARDVLEPLLILISPYAPHIAEELWSKLGHSESISEAAFPVFDESYLVESTKEYPISFNGKMRFKLELPLDMSKDDIEAAVMAHEKTAHYLEGRTPKKVIVVPGKIINIVG
ncbi:leucine--tRNA ligase [Aureitalea sp. L0-47]|uniref:leucine--tRNA ligase n=1 Tax=Aureitalea sp. L0-47 TaxID=2816962 RepID=UPI00223872F8|nr:leucine--tRNA ligase [Aureitalea sp. L0-47]MCW5518431.1 leucine--tRNA ligase [Aureitalea sp. L0-47]